MTRQELIAKVRFKIDEHRAFKGEEVFLGGQSVSPIDELIDNFIDEAIRELGLLLPATVEVIEITHISDELGGHGQTKCPLGFGRLIRLKVPSWNRDVTAERGWYSVLSEKYAEQRNPALRGRKDKPVAIYDRNDSNMIELYSVEPTDTEATIEYTKDEVGVEEVKDKNVLDLMIIKTAIKVLSSMKDSEGVKLLMGELEGKEFGK